MTKKVTQDDRVNITGTRHMLLISSKELTYPNVFRYYKEFRPHTV